MTPEEIVGRLDLKRENGRIRVNARESGDLEFKRDLTLATFKKSLKTVAAFSNQNGGSIVFGVQDKPRLLVGIGNQGLDEGVQSEHLVRSITPVPDTEFFFFEAYGFRLACVHVQRVRRPPVIAVRDLAGPEGEGQILKQGTIYSRRRGQTAPITGEEFNQLILARDESVRNEIFRFLSTGRNIGFDRAVVADPRSSNEEGEGVTFFIPAAEAMNLNVIDRARLVETEGAPAYEIRGNVQLTAPADHDPREPLRATESADQIANEIREIFWDDFPFSFSHLKKAAAHLGFWNADEGDGHHTGREPLTRTTVYYAPGRRAVVNWAQQNPTEFVDVVGSAGSRAAWARMRAA